MSEWLQVKGFVKGFQSSRTERTGQVGGALSSAVLSQHNL